MHIGNIKDVRSSGNILKASVTSKNDRGGGGGVVIYLWTDGGTKI